MRARALDSASVGYARSGLLPPCGVTRARKRPDLQFFTSYNELRLTNWGMLLKLLSIPMVVDFYAKFPFFVQCTNYAPSSSCCLRRGDELLRLGAVDGHIC